MLPAALACCFAAALLSGCASPDRHAPPGPADALAATPGEWHAVPLPGKAHTRYSWAHKEGRSALLAQSARSASMFRRHVQVEPQALRDVSFSWWVQDLIKDANVADADHADAPARVLFGFAGDVARLPMRTRVLFELAEALTGEKPPYATLVYVWDAQAPVGSVIVNARSDRIRKIVVDSGPGQLRRWREHRRDLAADFLLAFGEAPGALTSIAVMTDSDNTRSNATSWYGPVALHPRAQP
ncbi:MAG: DUF3047 domain-containing protein [Rubrivivax sp.]|nr:DUF3047 domain-containing protein [Rubrivivax sp.]